MLSALLKAQTAYNHQLLETQMMPALQNMRNAPDYAAVLINFYGFFLPLQNLVFPFITSEVLDDMEIRRSAENIKTDLNALGYNIEHETLATALPQISSVYEALGALYVLEGSTLGGKIIAKMIRQQTGITNALSFFEGYGTNTGPMWKKFLQTLDTKVPESEWNETIAAANDTFLSFYNWMQVPKA